MSSPQNSKLFLYESATQSRFDEATLQGQDVFFPASVRGWSDVLDCRPEPYNAQSLEENCHLAEHVHKKYILVSQAQLDKQRPPRDGDDA